MSKAFIAFLLAMGAMLLIVILSKYISKVLEWIVIVLLYGIYILLSAAAGAILVFLFYHLIT